MLWALSSQSSTDSLASLHCPRLPHTAAEVYGVSVKSCRSICGYAKNMPGTNQQDSTPLLIVCSVFQQA